MAGTIVDFPAGGHGNRSLVLVIEADPVLQRVMTSLLHDWGYKPVLAPSVDDATDALADHRFLFTLLDLDLGGTDGLEFLRRLRSRGGEPGPVIIVDDTADPRRAAEGISLGGVDIVQKSFTPDDLENAVKEAISRVGGLGSATDPDPTARLRREMALWRSPKMRELSNIVHQAARVDVTVLICGETGTGKEVVARAIHHLSARQGKSFVKVNCAAVPLELLESELFGHERGAFTGAHQLKVGKFELANRGTIFLDEIGDLHPALQAKLLHVLQDGTLSRVGGKVTLEVDVRVVAATNQDLQRAVLEERFRTDLYYRLNVIQITVPPLRERPEEIPLLLDYFIERYSRLYHREGFTVPLEVRTRVVEYGYPGNVRELENLVKRIIVLGDPLLSGTPLGPGGERTRTPRAPRPPPRPPGARSRRSPATPLGRRSTRPSGAPSRRPAGIGSRPRSSSGSATAPCCTRSRTWASRTGRGPRSSPRRPRPPRCLLPVRGEPRATRG